MRTIWCILKMVWGWEGGKWRRYYFLHPWRLYCVIRDQWPDGAKWETAKIDNDAIWEQCRKS
jgi:hypothetical protein